ncbi:MAG: ABC transporter permease [Candidatus Saccharibacteria bacterium]
MYKLIMNENAKIYRQRSSIIMMISLVALVVIVSLIIRFNMGIPDKSSVWEQVQSLLWISFFIKVFTIVIAGSIVANEYAWGTIKLLLIRPISRSRVLLAKYAAALLFGLLLMAILFITALVCNTALYGLDRVLMGGAASITITLKVYLLKYAEIFVYGTLAFMLSVLARSSTFATGFTLVTMFLGPLITLYITDHPLARYVLFMNTDLTIYAFNSSAHAGGLSLPFSLMVLAVYCLIFNTAAWLAFNKQEIS